MLPARFNGRAHLIALVRARIVHENDVAAAQHRRNNPFDVSQESLTIHGTVVSQTRFQHDHAGRRQSADAQRRDERQRFPVPVRDLGHQPLAHRRTPVKSGYLGVDRRLVDEEQAPGFQLRLLGGKFGARRGDIRSILFRRAQTFFKR